MRPSAAVLPLVAILWLPVVFGAKWFESTISPRPLYQLGSNQPTYGLIERQQFIYLYQSGILNGRGVVLFPDAATKDAAGHLILANDETSISGLEFDARGNVMPRKIIDPSGDPQNPPINLAIAAALASYAQYDAAIPVTTDSPRALLRCYVGMYELLDAVLQSVTPADVAALPSDRHAAYLSFRDSLVSHLKARMLDQKTRIVGPALWYKLAEAPIPGHDITVTNIPLEGGQVPGDFWPADAPVNMQQAAFDKLKSELYAYLDVMSPALSDFARARPTGLGVITECSDQATMIQAYTLAMAGIRTERDLFVNMINAANHKVVVDQFAAMAAADAAAGTTLGTLIPADVAIGVVNRQLLTVARNLLTAPNIQRRRLSRRDIIPIIAEIPDPDAVQVVGPATISSGGNSYCEAECGRKRGRKLGRNTLLALAQLGAVMSGIFPGKYTPAHPPPGGRWVGEDIRADTGEQVEDAFISIGRTIEAMLDKEPSEGVKDQITTALNTIAKDMLTTEWDEINFSFQQALLDLSTRLAKRLNAKRAYPAGVKMKMTEAQARSDFYTAVRVQTQNPNVLWDPAGDIFNPDNMYKGATTVAEAIGLMVASLQEAPLEDPATLRTLINVLGAKLSENTEVNDIEDINELETLLLHHNEQHPTDRIVLSTGYFVPSDRMISMLFVDALEQIRLITHDPQGLLDDPEEDIDGNILPSDLHEGATSTEEAFSLNAYALQSAAASFGSKESQIRLIRLRSNLRKMINLKREALTKARDKGQTISEDDLKDLNAIELHLGQVDYIVAGVELAAAAGLLVWNPKDGPTPERDPASIRAFPTFGAVSLMDMSPAPDLTDAQIDPMPKRRGLKLRFVPFRGIASRFGSFKSRPNAATSSNSRM